MKHFIAQVKGSLWKSDIYEQPTLNRTKTALGYITLLILVVSLIKIIPFGLNVSPTLASLGIFVNESAGKYPADMVLTLTKGTLSMNRKSPYVVPMKSENGVKPPLTNTLVIDTDKTLDFKTFSEYDTFILITKDGYMALDSRGTIKAQTFRSMPDTVISREKVDTYLGKFNDFIANFGAGKILLVSLALFILLSILTFIGVLLAALVGVLGVLAITSMKGHKLSFSQLYALSLYTMTAVLILGIIGGYIALPFFIYPLLFIVVLAVFVKDPKITPEQTPAAPTEIL